VPRAPSAQHLSKTQRADAGRSVWPATRKSESTMVPRAPSVQHRSYSEVAAAGARSAASCTDSSTSGPRSVGRCFGIGAARHDNPSSRHRSAGQAALCITMPARARCTSRATGKAAESCEAALCITMPSLGQSTTVPLGVGEHYGAVVRSMSSAAV
jgi:hypothetical protein